MTYLVTESEEFEAYEEFEEPGKNWVSEVLFDMLGVMN